jgi:hypothetical protein
MIVSTGTVMNSTWGHSITSSQYIIDSTNPNLQFTGTDRWATYTNYVLAPNGCYYGIPGTARCPIKIDPKTSISGSNTNFQSSTFTLITKSSVTGDDYFLPDYRDLSPPATTTWQKFGFGILAHDGKIYAMPYWSDRPGTTPSLIYRNYFAATLRSILVIDPNTDTYATASFNALSGTSSSRLFWSCVLGSDGYIYSIFNSDIDTNTRIVRFNPLTLFTTSANTLEYTNTLTATNGVAYSQASWAAFSSGSYVYFMPRNIRFGVSATPPAILKLNTTQFQNGSLNGVSTTPFPFPFSASSGTSPWGSITFGGVISLSSSLVVFSPRYLTSTSPLSQSLAYNPQTDTFSVLTHSLITENKYFGGGRNINGNGYLISGVETLPMFNLIESESEYSASIDSNSPLRNIDKYISTNLSANNNSSPSPIYKHVINQVNASLTSNIQYTASIAEFISVKGYYNGVTGFSPKDDGYLIPEDTSSLTSSLYNFYYNHV